MTDKNVDPILRDVSDTALWVAHYRLLETERPDALFRDPLAKALVGETGRKIADRMLGQNMHVQHNVVMRTLIIDQFIQDLVGSGVDTIVNLGAGLDTRPYRLQLPASIHWVEVDYPHMIELKNTRLANETPTCRLTRIPLDLADRERRKKLFAELAAGSVKACILTEGVLPYLTPDQVSELSEDIAAQNKFCFWIADYISPDTYKYLLTAKRKEQMKNAPFVFFPPDWFGFFTTRGWKIDSIRYIQELALEKGRMPPLRWWIRIMVALAGAKGRERFMRSSGYMLMSRKASV